MKIVASHMKVKLPTDAAVDAEVDLGTAHGGYFIQARLNIILPGVDPVIAQQIAETGDILYVDGGSHLGRRYGRPRNGDGVESV
jgi:hypothetical protein